MGGGGESAPRVEERARIGKVYRKVSFNKLISDVNNFKQHVARFLQTMPKYQAWTSQLVGISPELDADQRGVLTSHSIIPQDLNDLTLGLG